MDRYFAATGRSPQCFPAKPRKISFVPAPPVTASIRALANPLTARWI